MSNVNSINSPIILGPYSQDGTGLFHRYLVEANDKKILIDIPPLQYIERWAQDLSAHVEIPSIDYLILQTVDLSTALALEWLVEFGFRGQIVTTAYIAGQLKPAFSALSIVTNGDTANKLLIDGNLAFRFFELGFLPLPRALMTYWVGRGFLFSGMMFSGQWDGADDMTKIKSGIATFHQTTMPSSEYVKPSLRQITHLPIHGIYPAYGKYFSDSEVPPIIENEYRLDFYNSQQIIRKTESGAKDINFEEIANAIVNRLIREWGPDKVNATFKDGPIKLDGQTMEMIPDALTGYKLWNALFDQIYLKAGKEGLLALEPLVGFYLSQYGISRPTAYSSRLVEIETQKEMAEKEKKQLEEKIGELKSLVEATESRLLKDQNTGLYNEAFFKELMRKDLETTPFEPYVRGFLRVHIDQLPDINQKYGSVVGDESLRHLNYHIDQLKLENALTVKLAGPDLLVYLKETTPERLKATAIRLRNEVAASKLFIEKISVSIALATNKELDQAAVSNEKIRQLLLLLSQRIRQAQRLSKGQIVTCETEAAALAEGSILLIDEDDINRNMLTRIFKRINFEVVTAKDVLEAQKLLERQPIDVIISEINLAKIDGFAFKQTLNESQKFANLPFIMVSHSKTVANIRRANLLNVDLLLEKPIVPEELLGHVIRLKQRKQTPS